MGAPALASSAEGGDLPSPEELVQQLLSPGAYPHTPSDVHFLQTHASLLFIAGIYVYKIKRAVNYGFLDYSTLARRKRFCRLEADLNSPAAPGVYLGVAEVRRKDGKLFIADPGQPSPQGEVVEYAVKMRRLPVESSLSALLRTGRVTGADARGIGRLVASLHAQAKRSPAIARGGGIATLRRNVRENFRQTLPYVGRLVSQDAYADIVAYTLAFLETRAGVMQRRAVEGRVVDGHGDLKASDIYIVNGQVKVLDCIEFNRRFRYGDVASDLAFLAMDLDYHGCPDLSSAFVHAYLKASGDAEVMQLLGFFKCYRAYVRAKVNSFLVDDPALTAERRQEALETAQAYYRLAHKYAQAFPRPAVIIVCGIMGTGKTTIAAELTRRWNGTHVSSDVTRKALAGLAPTEHRYEAYGQGLYAAGMSQRTYQAMLAQARDALGRGDLVLLDATYRGAQERQEAARVADEAKAPLWILECVAPESVVRRRVLQRTASGASASDARWELYAQQKADWQPIGDDAPAGRHILVDTSGVLEKVMQRLLQELLLRAMRDTPTTNDSVRLT